MDSGAQYVNLGLNILFFVLVGGLLIAALVGFFRGVWKSTYRLLFMLGLFAIAFLTLNAFVDAAASFPINIFKSGTIVLTKEVSGEVYNYYVPITNAKETLTEFIKGFYQLNNISISEASATRFATAVSYSALKMVVFLVDVILILTLGNLFCSILWVAVFRRFIPEVARKKVKLRWLSMLETVATFAICGFLFLSPFTSIANAINQAYQRNNVKEKGEGIEKVEKIGNFVTAYNDSLFAKILFNWSVDQNGMTYDTRLFSDLTTGVSEDVSINLMKEIVAFVNLAANGIDSLMTDEHGNMVVNAPDLITKAFVDQAFDTVLNSTMIQVALPIVCEIAFNSDLLADYVPQDLVDLSDVEWESEMKYVKEMADSIFDSGVTDDLFVVDENGHKQFIKFGGASTINFVHGIVYSENFNSIIDNFKKIDDSKLLTRVVPALIQTAMDNDESGVMRDYLPFTWEQLNEFSWGYEVYVLFDFLHSTALLDEHLLDDILYLALPNAATTEEKETIRASLTDTIFEHAEDFKKLVVGNIDASGNLVNVDSRGQSIVFDSNGERISDRNYCLFDMGIINKALPSILEKIFDLEALKDIKANMSEDDINYYRSAVAELNNGKPIVNYKKEFNSILDSVVTLSQDKELVNGLIAGSGFKPIMAEEDNFFSIDASHLAYFKDAINGLNESKIAYSAVAPILKSLTANTDFVNKLNDLGLKASVFKSAIEIDMAKPKSQRTLFCSFGSLLDRFPDIYTITSLTGSSTGNISIDVLKDDDVIASLKNILNEIVDNDLLNPTPRVGDEFEKNENIFCLIENIFSSNPDLNLNIDRTKLRQVESNGRTWNDEIDGIGDILQFIAKRDIVNAGSTFEAGLTHSGISKLIGHNDDDYYIRGLFEAVDKSYIFKTSLGPFLDDMFGDSLNGFLIDTERHVTFSNVTNWSQEGENIENLLKSLDHILPEADSEAQTFFDNFDVTTLDKIVELNAMLHDLANSGIFTYIDEGGISHYQFGKWLYNLMDTSMGSFSVDENEYDLLSDPTFSANSVDSWDTDKWGIRPEDSGEPDPYYAEWKNEYNADNSKTVTHYIAYKDFAYVNGMADTDPRVASFWCDYDEFVSAQEAFTGEEYGSGYTAPSTYLANDWGKYYGSDEFMTDYENVFVVDEISRVMRFTCYAMRLLQPRLDETKIAFNEIPKDLLEGMLFSLNETHSMRVGMYNFYRIAAENVFNTYSSSGFSLDSAYFSYMIDVDEEMYDFDTARPLRYDELQIFVSFYNLLLVARENGVIHAGSFVFDKMRENNFLDTLKDTLIALDDSFVFHRKGSSKVDGLTTLQGLFNHLLADSEIGNSIYLGADSPKDAHNVSLYNSASSKVRYLVTSVFPDDADNPYNNRDSQKDEINMLTQAIDELYSLVDSGGNPATSILDANLDNDDNIDAIYRAMMVLNDSKLLADIVPNSIYKMFVSNPKFSVTVGSEAVDFSRIDPFYHYYYNVDTMAKLGVPNFTDAVYSSDDISGFRRLLVEYSTFKVTLNGGSVTDPNILKLLTGYIDGDSFAPTGALSSLLFTLHDSPIFHTPARNYDPGMYYTTKFEDGGYSLFEEMINDIALGSGIAAFAYDSSYDTFANESLKLHSRIKEVSKADDGYSANVTYSSGQGYAWDKEICALMEISYRAADLSTGSSIDVDSISLEDMTPDSAKALLLSINESDIASDALPKVVKKGFDAINLGALTSYNSVDYANYHLGQIAYGGASNDGVAETEIYNIYNVLSALRDGDHYVTSFNDINTFVSQDTTGARLEGLIRFIYESRILNTPTTGQYYDYYSVSGRSISAQGVTLFNVLDNANLSGFVSRSSDSSWIAVDLHRIQQLSAIVHMPEEDMLAFVSGDNYTVESKGLYRLINVINDSGIDSNTFVSSGHDDIQTVKSYRNAVLEIMNCAYDADGEGHRSALVSELVSGLLNNVLANDFSGLDNKAGYTYNFFEFGNPKYSPYLEYFSYSSLDAKEKNGMQGILDSLDYVSQLNVVALSSMSDTDRHALADNLEDCFALMYTDGENSEIARIVYLNNVHNSLKLISSVMNKDSQTFNAYLVNETSTSSTAGSNTVYAEDFSFADYGTALKNYIYPGFI